MNRTINQDINICKKYAELKSTVISALTNVCELTSVVDICPPPSISSTTQSTTSSQSAGPPPSPVGQVVVFKSIVTSILPSLIAIVPVPASVGFIVTVPASRSLPADADGMYMSKLTSNLQSALPPVGSNVKVPLAVSPVVTLILGLKLGHLTSGINKDKFKSNSHGSLLLARSFGETLKSPDGVPPSAVPIVKLALKLGHGGLPPSRDGK